MRVSTDKRGSGGQWDRQRRPGAQLVLDERATPEPLGSEQHLDGREVSLSGCGSKGPQAAVGGGDPGLCSALQECLHGPRVPAGRSSLQGRLQRLRRGAGRQQGGKHFFEPAPGGEAEGGRGWRLPLLLSCSSIAQEPGGGEATREQERGRSAERECRMSYLLGVTEAPPGGRVDRRYSGQRQPPTRDAPLGGLLPVVRSRKRKSAPAVRAQGVEGRAAPHQGLQNRNLPAKTGNHSFKGLQATAQVMVLVPYNGPSGAAMPDLEDMWEVIRCR